MLLQREGSHERGFSILPDGFRCILAEFRGNAGSIFGQGSKGVAFCLVDEVPDVNVEELHSQLVLHGLSVRLACDEPVGWFPDDAEPASPEFTPCASHLCQHSYSPGDVLRTAVQDLALAAVLIQEGENLERCRQRIALPRGQEQYVAWEGREDIQEEPFRASRSYEYDIQVAVSIFRKIVATEIEAIAQGGLDGREEFMGHGIHGFPVVE